MVKKEVSFTEKTLFLSVVTFLGGYLDAYTYLTRGGVFANNHTGNMAKLGIVIAQGNWIGALNCFVPILACVLGAAVSEMVKTHTTSRYHEWRKFAMFVEAAALFLIGLLPQSVPDAIINGSLSFITGYQLCLFRSSQWGAHNTTICTGNLRSVGQYLYGAAHDKTTASVMRFVMYTALVFSFVLGSAVGVPLCSLLGTFASIVGAFISAGIACAMIYHDKHQSSAAA